MKSITVGKFPLPPSSNHQYFPLVLPGKAGGRNAGRMVPRMIPTDKLKFFKNGMANWHLTNQQRAKQARMFALECFARKNFVRLDTYWCVPKAEIFYLNGNVKKSDLYNRLKALHDEFCAIAEFDDSRIKAGYTEQMGIEGLNAFSFVVLSEHRFRMISEYEFGEVPK